MSPLHLLTRDILKLAELLVAAEGLAARLGLRVCLEPLESPPAEVGDQ